MDTPLQRQTATARARMVIDARAQTCRGKTDALF
jgi:hypothetical protein